MMAFRKMTDPEKGCELARGNPSAPHQYGMDLGLNLSFQLPIGLVLGHWYRDRTHSHLLRYPICGHDSLLWRGG